VPSVHIACMITASLRTTATVALRWPARLAIDRPQVLTLSLRLKRRSHPALHRERGSNDKTNHLQPKHDFEDGARLS
jgi:hypothetical protein